MYSASKSAPTPNELEEMSIWELNESISLENFHPITKVGDGYQIQFQNKTNGFYRDFSKNLAEKLEAVIDTRKYEESILKNQGKPLTLTARELHALDREELSKKIEELKLCAVNPAYAFWGPGRVDHVVTDESLPRELVGEIDSLGGERRTKKLDGWIEIKVDDGKEWIAKYQKEDFDVSVQQHELLNLGILGIQEVLKNPVNTYTLRRNPENSEQAFLLPNGSDDTPLEGTEKITVDISKKNDRPSPLVEKLPLHFVETQPVYLCLRGGREKGESIPLVDANEFSMRKDVLAKVQEEMDKNFLKKELKFDCGLRMRLEECSGAGMPKERFIGYKDLNDDNNLEGFKEQKNPGYRFFMVPRRGGGDDLTCKDGSEADGLEKESTACKVEFQPSYRITFDDDDFRHLPIAFPNEKNLNTSPLDQLYEEKNVSLLKNKADALQLLCTPLDQVKDLSKKLGWEIGRLYELEPYSAKKGNKQKNGGEVDRRRVFLPQKDVEAVDKKVWIINGNLIEMFPLPLSNTGILEVREEDYLVDTPNSIKKNSGTKAYGKIKNYKSGFRVNDDFYPLEDNILEVLSVKFDLAAQYEQEMNMNKGSESIAAAAAQKESKGNKLPKKLETWKKSGRSGRNKLPQAVVDSLQEEVKVLDVDPVLEEGAGILKTVEDAEIFAGDKESSLLVAKVTGSEERKKEQAKEEIKKYQNIWNEWSGKQINEAHSSVDDKKKIKGQLIQYLDNTVLNSAVENSLARAYAAMTIACLYENRKDLEEGIRGKGSEIPLSMKQKFELNKEMIDSGHPPLFSLEVVSPTLDDVKDMWDNYESRIGESKGQIGEEDLIKQLGPSLDALDALDEKDPAKPLVEAYGGMLLLRAATSLSEKDKSYDALNTYKTIKENASALILSPAVRIMLNQQMVNNRLPQIFPKEIEVPVTQNWASPLFAGKGLDKDSSLAVDGAIERGDDAFLREKAKEGQHSSRGSR